LNTSELTQLATKVISLLAEYRGKGAPKKERAVDPVFYAFLKAELAGASRQHCVYMYGSAKPHRIDFRTGGTNPSVIELAVRPPKGGYELDGPHNLTELRKLARVKQDQAKMRFLLLTDLSSKGPLDRAKLKGSYDPLHAGRGKFSRNPIRVVYVHSDGHFNFVWKPYA
jgi:hypothetical protein